MKKILSNLVLISSACFLVNCTSPKKSCGGDSCKTKKVEKSCCKKKSCDDSCKLK